MVQSQNKHLTLKLLSYPPIISLHNTHLCFEWGSCGTHTHFLYIFLSPHFYSFLVSLMVCIGSFNLIFVLIFWFGGSFALLQIRISKDSHILFKFLLDLDGILLCCARQGDVQYLHLSLDVFLLTSMVLEY